MNKKDRIDTIVTVFATLLIFAILGVVAYRLEQL